MFAHYMFESVAALMKFICETQPDSVAVFESMLFAPFQEVLTRDAADFMPYVFQLLAQLLDLRPIPRAGAFMFRTSMMFD
jgi:exportin-2 (importin alpha re-exporter)